MDTVLLLGVVTGMRSMTALAVLCWAAWLGLVPEHGWATWISYLAAAIVFSACALAEYVVDTLPKTPSRTAAVPAMTRFVIGALVGALVATAVDEPLAGGILLGAVGAMIGTWGGYWMRMGLDRMVRHDLPVAVVETASAIVIAVLAVAKLHRGIVMETQHAQAMLGMLR
ncbi:MAG TPA: DUF4126 domain-containing protein [Acidobacteriaceae bacterium]|jgi:uncharacterized membrane protein|nr:DUF4126 domain-containing protein [Acidobacteriaceae bacterium]